MTQKKGTSNRQNFKWNTEILCPKYLGIFLRKLKRKKLMHPSSDESVKHMCEGNFTSISQMHELIIYQRVVRAFYHQKVNKAIPSYCAQFLSKVIKERCVKTIPGPAQRQRWGPERIKCLLRRNSFDDLSQMSGRPFRDRWQLALVF